MSWIKFTSAFCKTALKENATEHMWLLVNIGSGNGLVPSGFKPLLKPKLTQIYVSVN